MQYRRIVKDGESLKNQEHMTRIRFEEKMRKLATMAVEENPSKLASWRAF